MAPSDAPNPTMAKSRFPSSTVYTSFANAQSWAMIMRLKIPTQMKNATPMGTPAWDRPKNATRHATKNSVTELISRTRETREAIALYNGTRMRRSPAIAAAA